MGHIRIFNVFLDIPVFPTILLIKTPLKREKTVYRFLQGDFYKDVNNYNLLPGGVSIIILTN